MEKRAVVFALSEPNAIQAILKLKENKDINLRAWVGVDKGQGVVSYDYGRLLDVDIQKEVAMPVPKVIYDRVYQHLWDFINMVYRSGDSPVYKYLNKFNLWLRFYYGLFTKEKINLLIFGDVPHFGVDSIAKDLADAMGIKTVLFLQALEANRFFAFTDISDVGVFKTLGNSDSLHVEVEEKFEKDLFYMKNIEVYTPTASTALDKKAFFRRVYNIARRHPEQILEKSKKNIMRKLNRVISRNIAENEYVDSSRRYTFHNEINLMEKFVYFPLHMQPEMTTSALGGKFCDQVLAIERLREMLPGDWKIYVKENPIQSYYMRDDLFFRRLKLIPNTFLLGREVNTYDLIKNSQFVATITGTAGWEAISGGKCALVFGLAWYRKLPGVFEYTNGVTVEEILNYQINHEDVVKKYKELMGRSYRGILECGYEKDVEDYSDEKNNVYLYDAFRKIIAKLFVE